MDSFIDFYLRNQQVQASHFTHTCLAGDRIKYFKLAFPATKSISLLVVLFKLHCGC